MVNIDDLIFQAVFSKDENNRRETKQGLKELARKKGIFPASILPLYQAFGRKEINGFSVPAINIRFLTYDTARIVFRLMQEENIGPIIFEIAKSEQQYTAQNPDEYTAVILAAALKENYQGPVFLQGDHYQFSAKQFSGNPESEIQNLKSLIKNSIEAGFYNIDIDASTLVDYSKTSLDEQQKSNYEMTALLTKYILGLESSLASIPNISIGAEIGHIGGKNSTVEEFESFINGFNNVAAKFSSHESLTPNMDKHVGVPSEVKKISLTPFLSKISVQTGTSHGGVIGSDGKVLPVSLDFSVLKNIGQVAREKYGLGGAVQHGASTLPDDLFGQFPDNETLEVHLSTGWQNIVFDHLPLHLKNEMYDWISGNCKKEDSWTEEQFYYKMRKKTAGPFKEKLWKMSQEEKKPIVEALEAKFRVIFEKLRVFGTKETMKKYL